jgi:signal transduction histidine kinase
MDRSSLTRLIGDLRRCAASDEVLRTATVHALELGAAGACALQADPRSGATRVVAASGSLDGASLASGVTLENEETTRDAGLFEGSSVSAGVRLFPFLASRCTASLAVVGEADGGDDDTWRTLAETAGLALDRVIAERAAENARKELKSARAKMGFLIRGVTHDLKNPIGAVDGYLQLLEAGVRGDLTEAQREWTGRISVALKRMLALLNDLLDLARIDSGALQLDLHPLPFPAVLREATEALRLAALPFEIGVDTQIEEGLPAVTADLSRVRQAVDKMLFHALRTAKRGSSIRVALAAGPNGPRPGDWVALHVRSDGKTLEPEVRNKILEGLVKVEVDQERDTGTGLELAIARRVARAMGGDVAFIADGDAEPPALTLWLPSAAR